jgi:hypothetical protein
VRPLFKAYFPVLFSSTKRVTGYSEGKFSKHDAHSRNKSSVAAVALEELGRRPRRDGHEELGSRGSSTEEILSYGIMRTTNVDVMTGGRENATPTEYGRA